MKKFDEKKDYSLVEETTKLINECKMDDLELFVITGIHPAWLMKFRKGGFKNPSVNRVQYLYEFFTGKQLIKG